MSIKPENVLSYSFVVFFVFGSYLYTIGMLMEVLDRSGFYFMIAGVGLCLCLALISLINRKKPFITASSAIGCFIFAGYSLTKIPFLNQMEELQQEMNAIGDSSRSIAGDIPTLLFVNMVVIITFLALGVVETVVSIHLHKKYGNDWKHARYGQTSSDDSTNTKERVTFFAIEPTRYKYCPKCLHQEQIESKQELCPTCKTNYVLPEETSQDEKDTG